MNEKYALLNDPLPQEFAMAVDFGLKVVQPKDIANAKVCECSLVYGSHVRGQVAKSNVLTIGAAFYYALRNIRSE